MIVKTTHRRPGASPKGESRLNEIRDEATRIFAERGYHGASMQDLATALGLHKANLYYYYRSKEDLLFDILTHADRQITIILDAEAQATGDPLALIERSVAAHVTWYLQHPDIAKVSFRDWSALTGPRLDEQIARRRRYSHRLRDCLRRCQQLGVISSELDVTIAANFINGAVAATNNWFSPQGSRSAAAIGAAFGKMAAASVIEGTGFPPEATGGR